MKLLACFTWFLAAACAATFAGQNQQNVEPAYMQNAGSRTFEIEYVGKVLGVPKGARKLRIWMPVPQDSTVQTIRHLSFSARPEIMIEPKYGNKIAYWETENPKAT